MSAIPRRLLIAALIALPTVSLSQIKPLDLVLPTENQNIFGKPEQFYMYTDRSFEGVASKPWQAGRFGYVRNPKRTDAGLIYTKFHEGVDIRPLKRDAAGEPTDIVHSIGGGTVVHLNPARGGSSYGRYAVIEHDWGHGPFYSLYAHLESILPEIEVGKNVTAGQPIAVLGYTGVGLDRTRAHLHLEFCMRLSGRFNDWYNTRYREPNIHGNFNGLNLAGIDIATLFAAHRKNPSLNLPAFILSTAPYFRVRVPNVGPLEIAETYPWLLTPEDSGRLGGTAGGVPDPSDSPSWEITFSASGLPLNVRPAADPTTIPVVTWVKPSPTYHSYLTRERLGGSGEKATLQSSGAAYVQLVSGAFPAAPAAETP